MKTVGIICECNPLHGGHVCLFRCAKESGADAVIATAEYGAELTAAVAKGNVMGCQFHPEKSGDVGLSILRTFCEGDW